MPKHPLRSNGRLAVAALCLVVALLAASRHWGWNSASPLWRFVTAHQHDNPSRPATITTTRPHHDDSDHDHKHATTRSLARRSPARTIDVVVPSQCNIGLTGEYLKRSYCRTFAVRSQFPRSIGTIRPDTVGGFHSMAGNDHPCACHATGGSHIGGDVTLSTADHRGGIGQHAN